MAWSAGGKINTPAARMLPSGINSLALALEP